MTPTLEQIYKAAYWYNKNIRALKTIKDLDTPHILAAYAARRVAEAMKEKDLCGKLEINKLNRTIAALVEFVPDNVISDEVKFAKQRVTELFLEKDAEIARLQQALSVIESMDADYRIGTDSNMERLRVIARAALQEKKP